ncbi:hypothetical protein [Mycetocola lacteus]|uniref:hypothetical protein n=1 Tax=Mycetocola lacteus TaxID=76637 RepID=UPI0016022288|nr:hypothetical protein [Mycetocola lacteus]
MADTQHNAPNDERERFAEEMPAFGSEAVRNARIFERVRVFHRVRVCSCGN